MVARGEVPASVRIGALFPMFYPGGGRSEGGIRSFAAFLMGLREINDKTDGIADWLLPNTSVTFNYVDSKCDATFALRAALELAFREVAAVVGAWCSGPTISIASLMSIAEVPQISYGAMSNALSDGLRFPYFARTVPAVDIEAAVISDLLQHLFGYTAIAIVNSNDAYGMASAAAVVQSLHYDVKILISITINNAGANYGEAYGRLIKSEARVILLLTQASSGNRFLAGAHERGIGGNGFLWLGNGGSTDSGIFLNEPMRQLGEKERLTVMRGFFGVVPSSSRSHHADSFLERLRSIPPSNGDGENCSLERDSAGDTLIFAQDTTGNGVLTCGGTPAGHNASSMDDVWAAFAYDAVYAVKPPTIRAISPRVSTHSPPVQPTHIPATHRCHRLTRALDQQHTAQEAWWRSVCRSPTRCTI